VRTDRLQREFGVGLQWRVFPLHPETPEGGTALADLFPGNEAKIAQMHERLAGIAAAEGLPMSPGRTRTYNSRLAQELGKWAESRGAGDPFRRAVYNAFFVEGIDIGRADALVRIAGAVGLDPAEARGALEDRLFAPAVDADWRRARETGVTAVPTHDCDGRRLVGFAPYEDFRRLIGKG
jgi:predicted DsbA family dithiol-disulfide isomerase